MSNTAAVLTKSKGSISIEQRPIPKPQAHQLLVKNHAIAVNPVDFKIQDSGYFIQKYPTILGSDIAGTVEAVGEGVTKFKKGDRVAGFAGVIINNDPDHGAFQEYTLLFENATTRLPEAISFEEGSILPMAVATAGVGIFPTMDIPRPSANKQSGGFLVWGGSSSVGSAVVQIAHALGFTVFAVASTHHHHMVNKLGAKATFDYKDSKVIDHIVNAAKEHKVEIKYAFDAISEHGSPQQAAKVLEHFGGGKLCLTLPWPEDVEKPEGVEVVNTGAFRILTDQKDFGAYLFNDWLAESLVNKTYVPSPGIELVKGGIPSVQDAFNQHKKGLSGKKLVLKLI
ncbi:hypothetical protein MMC11_001250 [Xylographa trunciseda]|nr:hypothetical protein [Xylographa trunciseda]